jgi:hypothetical protein
MAIERKFELVEPDAPDRCQAVHNKGQCRYKACENSTYCPMHGGNKAQAAKAELVKRQYQLAKWQASVDSFADEDQVKSLRGEVGIARLILQEIVAKCQTSNDLLLFSGKITDMLMRVEKLVVSCHRLENNLGLVLDKSAALNLATMIIEIIGKHVTDDDIIGKIAEDLAKAIQGSSKNG